MAVGLETIIPTGVVLTLAYLGIRKPKGSSKKKAGPKVCAPFKAIDEAAVTAQTQAFLASGMKGFGRVSAAVAKALYPKDVNNKTIPWPTSPPWELPADAPAPYLCLYGEIRRVVSDLPVPDEPDEPDPTPSEILTGLLASSPTPGKFYQMVAGGPNAAYTSASKPGVLAMALNKVIPGAGQNAQRRLAYLNLMTRGWNWNYYSRTTKTSTWGAAYNFNGRNIGTAWLPRHENAIQAIASGRYPMRTIDLAGNKMAGFPGSSFGLLWFPPIDEAALAAGAVVIKKWSNGQDADGPPPELTSLLT